MVLALLILALTTEAKKGIHFHLKEGSINHGADYEDERGLSEKPNLEKHLMRELLNCVSGKLWFGAGSYLYIYSRI